jgi:hypothetical protein
VTRLAILATALLAAIMSAALVAFMTHRPPEARAPLYPPEEDGVQPVDPWPHWLPPYGSGETNTATPGEWLRRVTVWS